MVLPINQWPRWPNAAFRVSLHTAQPGWRLYPKYEIQEIKMIDKPYRQGDVLLIPIVPVAHTIETEDQPYENKLVLARGERSGHAHVIEADGEGLPGFLGVPLSRREERSFAVLTGAAPRPAGARVLRLLRPATLKHTDAAGRTGEKLHAPLTLPPGDYEVRQQREWAGEQPVMTGD